MKNNIPRRISSSFLVLLVLVCIVFISHAEHNKIKSLNLVGPTATKVGKSTTFTCRNEDGEAIPGVKLKTFFIGNSIDKTKNPPTPSSTTISGKNGKATFSFNKQGDYIVLANKENFTNKPSIVFRDDFSNTDKWLVSNILKVEGQAVAKSSDSGSKISRMDGEKVLKIDTYSEKLWKVNVSPTLYSRVNSIPFWRNYSLSFKFKILEGDGGLQVVFRKQDIRRYSVGLSRNYVGMTKFFPKGDYDEPTLGQEHNQIQGQGIDLTNRWHNVKLRVVGNNLQLFIDSKEIFDIKDDSVFGQPPSLNGYFHLTTYGKLKVVVDNFTVKLASSSPKKATAAVRVEPRGNKNIIIRGVKDKELDKAPEVGANYVKRIINYEVDPKTGKITRTMPIKKLKDFVKASKELGFRVYLAPFLWWPNQITSPERSLTGNVRKNFLQEASKLAVEMAKWVEKYDVEIFSPISNLESFVKTETAVNWYKTILPSIKEVYTGKTAQGKIQFHKRDPEVNKHDFSGYDYVTAVPSPPKLTSSAMKPEEAYRHYRETIEKMVAYTKKWVKEDETEGVMVPFVSTDFGKKFVQAELAKGRSLGEIRARTLRIFFEETVGKIDGFFLDSWEQGSSKVFMRSSQMVGHHHIKQFNWGYQGPEVEKLVKKYYSSTSTSGGSSLATEENKDKVTVPLSRVTQTSDKCKLSPEQLSKEMVKIPISCVSEEYLRSHGFLTSSEKESEKQE